MSTLYVPNAAEVMWLIYMLQYIKDNGPSIFADLFKVNVTIDDDTVLGDLQGAGKTADYSGYAQQSLNLSSTDVVAGGDGRAYFLTPTITFPLSGASSQTVYGVVYTDFNGLFMGAIKFGTPVTVSTTVRPDPYQQKFTLRQEPF